MVNASSEPGRLAVNGMSYSGRDGKNANSAIIVAVTPADYGSDHPLAGIEFQRRLEQRAYELCDGKLPVQRYGDFREKVTGEPRKIQNGPKDGLWDNLEPQCKGAFAWADLTGILPGECNQAFVEGMDSFDRQIHGFASLQQWTAFVWRNRSHHSLLRYSVDVRSEIVYYADNP